MIKLPPISTPRGSSDKNTRPYTPNDSATHPQGLLPRLIPRYKVPKLKLPLRSIAGSNTDQLKLRHDLLELQVPLKFRL
ncbi:hypothetical protein K7432_013384 [Basidiobolus ranarum]|uniref:Uncharacterized protein n=1 Tax=Basidiobolus ranarum TaxID=34480 RepID=A0ABR2WJB9_9FUNG